MARSHVMTEGAKPVEAGLYNLTNDEVPVLVHFAADRQEVPVLVHFAADRQDGRVLIRLKKPEAESPSKATAGE